MTFRPSRSRVRLTARLFLDALDSRDLPSAPVPVETPPTSPGQYTSTTTGNPVITSFEAVVGPNGQVTFRGTVTDDESMEGCLVTIEGPGVFAAAIVHNGAFQTSTTVFGESPITVHAVAIDADGNLSNEASDTFTPSAVSGGGSIGGPGVSTGTATPPPPPPGGP